MPRVARSTMRLRLLKGGTLRVLSFRPHRHYPQWTRRKDGQWLNSGHCSDHIATWARAQAHKPPNQRRLRGGGLSIPTGIYPTKLGRCSTVVLMGSMESVMKGRGRVIDTASLDRVIDQYVQMFSRMTSNWKRVVYLSSPDAAFWDVVDRERYDWAGTEWQAWLGA